MEKPQHEGMIQILPEIPIETFLFPRKEIEEVCSLEFPRFAVLKVGIENSASSCFINCILQCLCHSVPLVHFLNEKTHSKRCSLKTYCAFCSLESFFIEMMKLDPDRYILRPVEFLNNIEVFGDFKKGRQEDASLFLTGLAMAMQTAEFESYSVKNPTEALENSTMLHQVFGGFTLYYDDCPNCEWSRKKVTRWQCYSIFI